MKLKTASIRPRGDLNGNEVNDVDLGFSNMCTRNFRGTASESDQRMACPGRGGGEAAWGTGLGEPQKLSFWEHKDDKGPPGSRPPRAAWHSAHHRAWLALCPPSGAPSAAPPPSQSPQSLVSEDPGMSRNILTVLNRKRIVKSAAENSSKRCP